MASSRRRCATRRPPRSPSPGADGPPEMAAGTRRARDLKEEQVQGSSDRVRKRPQFMPRRDRNRSSGRLAGGAKAQKPEHSSAHARRERRRVRDNGGEHRKRPERIEAQRHVGPWPGNGSTPAETITVVAGSTLRRTVGTDRTPRALPDQCVVMDGAGSGQAATKPDCGIWNGARRQH